MEKVDGKEKSSYFQFRPSTDFGHMEFWPEGILWCIHCPIVCRLDSAGPVKMSLIWTIFAAIWCKVIPIF